MATWDPDTKGLSKSVKDYHGFWIQGLLTQLAMTTNSGNPQSSTTRRDSCERYVFALYGSQSNGEWIELGHEISYAPNLEILNLEVLPHREDSTFIHWDNTNPCIASDLRIQMRANSQLYEQNTSFHQNSVLMDTPSLNGAGRNFTVSLVYLHSEHNYVLWNTTTFFHFTKDSSLKWMSSSFTNDEVSVTWQRRPIKSGQLVSLWEIGWDFLIQFLPGDSTAAVLKKPDHCDRQELTLIEWHHSGARVLLGHNTLEEDWQSRQETNLVPTADGVLIHWKRFTLCRDTVFRFELQGVDYDDMGSWEPGEQDDLFVPLQIELNEMNVTYIARHSVLWTQQFTIRYHLQRKHELVKFKDIRYGKNEITIEPWWPSMDHQSLLQIAVLDQDAMVHMSTRYSTDTSPIILPVESCKALEMTVVHLVDGYTRMLLGSAQIDPGRITITGMKSTSQSIQVNYTIEHCHPDNVKIHVTHSSSPHSPKTRIIPGMVELTDLKPCVVYDFQLIAFYSSHYDVSEMKRTALALDHNDSRLDVSIKHDHLVIKWKPRTECLLQAVTVKILRNGLLWMTYNFTDGSQKTTTSVPKSNAVYAVSVEFSYEGLFVERSEYVVINYETEQPVQLGLQAQVEAQRVHLSWTIPRSYSPLYYRLDGLYNNLEPFVIVLVNQEYILPIPDRTDYVSLTVTAVSTSGIKQASSQITVWPKKIPQKPVAPLVTNKNQVLHILWKLNETDHIDRLNLFIQSTNGAWKRQIDNPRSKGEFELRNTFCPSTECTVTLQAVNKFGASIPSQTGHIHQAQKGLAFE